MRRPVFFRLGWLEDSSDILSMLSDDAEGEFDLVDLAHEKPIVSVPAMHDEVAFRSDALDDWADGKGKYEGTRWVTLLISLLAA